MSRVTLDLNSFKALASETRLDILRVLDGKKMSLNELSETLNLNKATVHEHLMKLYEAGLVKRKEREGHKWVYYKLSWKGASLLHPDNTKIVILFTITIASLFIGISEFIVFLNSSIRQNHIIDKSLENIGATDNYFRSTSYFNNVPIIIIISIIISIVFLIVTIWIYHGNRKPKL